MKLKAKNIISIIIAVICVIVIIFAALNLLGVYDINANINERQSQEDNTVYGDWESRPFGSAGIVLKMTSVGEKLNFTYLNSDENIEFYMKSEYVDFASGESYDTFHLTQSGYDSKNKEVFCIAFLPEDCKYALINGEKVLPQSGTVDTAQGKLDFKLLLTTYKNNYDSSDSADDEVSTAECVLVDEKGNEHYCSD